MKDLEVWEFVLDRFEAHQKLALLVVAQSSGSSPGRQGFKMAVTANGKMKGSIGGGIMENKLIDMAITHLKEDRLNPSMFRQIHRESHVVIVQRAQSGIFSQVGIKVTPGLGSPDHGLLAGNYHHKDISCHQGTQ